MQRQAPVELTVAAIATRFEEFYHLLAIGSSPQLETTVSHFIDFLSGTNTARLNPVPFLIENCKEQKTFSALAYAMLALTVLNEVKQFANQLDQDIMRGSNGLARRLPEPQQADLDQRNDIFNPF